MRPKIITGLLLLVLPFVGLGQTKLHLEFEPGGDLHKVWISEAFPSGEPVEFKTPTADLLVDSSLSKPKVWVEDEKSGNMASHDFASLGGKWVLKAADYVNIAEIAVRVESKGQSVASAELGITDTGLGKTALLTPSDKGQVIFLDIPPGRVNLTVRYKVGGKDADPIEQGFQVALKRDRPQPVLIVSIPDAVDVVPAGGTSGTPTPGTSGAPASGAPASPSASTPPVAIGSPLGQAITIVLVLALVLGGGWWVMQQMKKSGDTVSDKLRQLGVDVPKPIGDPDPTAATPIQPLRHTGPPEKIVLGASADPVTMSPIAPIPSTGVPTLRMTNGDAFELPEGETLVGRELGLGLSLPSETTVSRQHATITRTGHDIRVKDLGSSNGTYVNGVKVTADAQIRSGDTVQFGSVQCRFEG